ncbi:hypothetical protein PENANT_c182G06637 [Penicillium antarcticum]|uniref:Uncharacterized protein n=1 Tax=Penicillium antarcticum TaxID=416450 RepID=A0A1V6PCI3_9EURO|nr:hypothetical protein PENANT_c182G06637 [Penicillium antarcticum]
MAYNVVSPRGLSSNIDLYGGMADQDIASFGIPLAKPRAVQKRLQRQARHLDR